MLAFDGWEMVTIEYEYGSIPAMVKSRFHHSVSIACQLHWGLSKLIPQQRIASLFGTAFVSATNQKGTPVRLGLTALATSSCLMDSAFGFRQQA